MGAVQGQQIEREREGGREGGREGEGGRKGGEGSVGM